MQVEGVSPNYMLVVDRVNSTDVLEVRVELNEDMFTDTVGGIENIRDEIKEKIKSVVGISAKVQLVPPKSIQRFEGQG